MTKINETRKNESKISYIVDNTNHLILLEETGFIDVCYGKFIRTQSAETYIITDPQNFFSGHHVNADYNKYFNNKLTIIYKRLEDQIKDAYLKNSRQTCENEISIIKEKF